MIDNVDINKMISPVASRGKVKSIDEQHPDKQQRNFTRQLIRETENNRKDNRKGRFYKIDSMRNNSAPMQDIAEDGDEDNTTMKDKLNKTQGILLDIIV